MYEYDELDRMLDSPEIRRMLAELKRVKKCPVCKIRHLSMDCIKPSEDYL